MADRIAVIGAGQMGNGIAHVFAQSGFDVAIVDVSEGALAKGRETIAKNLDRQIKKGTIREEDKASIMGRVSTHTSIDAVAGAALIVEAATENRDLKFRIFADLGVVVLALPQQAAADPARALGLQPPPS